MPRSVPGRYRYADHVAIPEDHQRHEIIDGKLFVSPTPSVKHQMVLGNVAFALLDRVEQHGLGSAVVGPITLHLGDELVLEPDVIFVRKDRLDIIDPQGDVHGPPNLVVEVLSAGAEAYDRELKRKGYQESGVGELWILDVEARAIEVWRAGENEPRMVVDGVTWTVEGNEMEITLDEVFRGLD